MRDLRLNLGLTYANTKYRNDLVGNDDGAPLDPALRKLPGRQSVQRAGDGRHRLARLDAARSAAPG